MFEYLQFDSGLFKKKIGKIVYRDDYSPRDLVSDTVRFQDELYNCVYFEFPENRADLVEECKKRKLFFAGTRVTLVKKLVKKGNVKIGEPEETGRKTPEAFIEDLAEEICRVSRFYRDPFFRHNANKLFSLWVRKSFAGNYADKWFVSGKNGTLTGGISMRRHDGNMFIDLFGILPAYRRQGYGTILLEKAMKWSAENDSKELHVHTQQENKAAMGAYMKSGFSPVSVNYIYHIRK